MSDFWPQKNRRESFQLSLSPILYYSVPQIVFRCEIFFCFGDGEGIEHGEGVRKLHNHANCQVCA